MDELSSMFCPGDTVVCTNDDFQANPYPKSQIIETPRKGAIYTVREVTLVEMGGIGVRFKEIKNKPMPVNGTDHVLEPCFSEKRFKKISVLPLVAL